MTNHVADRWGKEEHPSLAYMYVVPGWFIRSIGFTKYGGLKSHSDGLGIHIFIGRPKNGTERMEWSVPLLNPTVRSDQ